MPRITLDLLRRRAEHNEGMISSLEEISLHQEELEKIEVIGTMCRKLQILYLQNNIIEKIEDLTHMKDLKYLNVALNNISKIEGLRRCEFLEKLDLTVNFIDVDTFEESIEHLQPLEHFRELHMIGNSVQVNWEGYRDYIVASLPRLQSLDGKDISRTERIQASQKYGQLQAELRILAEKMRKAKSQQAQDKEDGIIEVRCGKATDISEMTDEVAEDVAGDDDEADDKVPYTKESRREMYIEIAEQKAEQEKSRSENMPKERDYEKEHQEAMQKARKREDEGRILQCNEGKWDYIMDDEENPEFVTLEIFLPKHLSSSLIDIDAHPTYVTVVIKNKLLRLRFPEECNSDAGKAQRSKITGALKLTFPKSDEKSIQRAKLRKEYKSTLANEQAGKKTEKTKTTMKLADEILTASKESKAVSIRGIVKVNDGNTDNAQLLREVKKPVDPSPEDEYNDDEPPPLF